MDLAMSIARTVVLSVGAAWALLVSSAALFAGDNSAHARANSFNEPYAEASRNLIDIKVADMKIERDRRICYAMKTGGDLREASDRGPLLELHTELRCPDKAPFTEVTSFRLAEITSYRELHRAYPHQCEVECAWGKRCIVWTAPTASVAFSRLAFRTPEVCTTFAAMIASIGKLQEAGSEPNR